MSKERSFFRGDISERLRILSQSKFDFVFGSVAAFGGSFATYLFSDTDVPKWVSGLCVFVWLVVLFVLIFFRATRQEMAAIRDEEVQKAKTLQDRLNRDRRDEAINLTDRAMNCFARSLRTLTEELRTLPKTTRGNIEGMSADFYSSLKNHMLRQLFRELRSVFEGDTRGIDSTTWPHNFFKIALFEPERDPDGSILLRRSFFDYPEGILPSVKTEVFDVKRHDRAAIVLAYAEQNIVVIEDIKTENAKAPDVKRWINLRENQADDYESMICASIVRGVRQQPERECLGVLVIDTNRERYFQEDRSYQAFLGNVLNPFRTILTFVLELRTYFK